MSHHRRLYPVLLGATIFILLMATSCSSGPEPPRMGTPPFFWGAARETFVAGDFVKTTTHLEQLTRNDNEFAARALPFRLVLTGGMAKGFAELADTYDAGAHANRINPTPFRKLTSDYRTTAGRLSLQFGEAFMKFAKRHDEQIVPLAFPFPTGDAAPVQDLSKVSFGASLPQSTHDAVQKKVVERAVILSACAAVGAADDVAKAQAIFKADKSEVPHDVFVLWLAQSLYDLSDVFGRTKLDQPDRVELFCNEATEALKSVKEGKATKDLAAKIQKKLKGLKSGK